jgi:ketosteroid isomerase-like protein
MRVAARAVIGVAVLCLFYLAVTPAAAQEWSAAQKEVWNNVEAYWDLSAKGDLEGFMSYFHPDYRGWSYQSPVPGTKETARKFLTYELATTKTVVYQITPVAIQVHGNFAFVAYYYNEIDKDAEGKVKNRQGRWLDILTKQGDRWVMIGDHGGDQPVDD